MTLLSKTQPSRFDMRTSSMSRRPGSKIDLRSRPQPGDEHYTLRQLIDVTAHRDALRRELVKIALTVVSPSASGCAFATLMLG